METSSRDTPLEPDPVASPLGLVLFASEDVSLDLVRDALLRSGEAAILAEVHHGSDLVDAVATLHPAGVVAVLDGRHDKAFEALGRPEVQARAAVVVASSESADAGRAFDVDAVDYLHLPTSEVRVSESFRRILRRLDRRERRGAPPAPDLLLASGGALGWFVVRSRGRIRLLRPDRVRWMRSTGNYVELHHGAPGTTSLVRATVGEIERLLDRDRFRRIHRSTVVAIDEIEDIVSDGHGGYEVRLKDGEKLRMSRSYRDNLLPTGGG